MPTETQTTQAEGQLSSVSGLTQLLRFQRGQISDGQAPVWQVTTSLSQGVLAQAGMECCYFLLDLEVTHAKHSQHLMKGWWNLSVSPHWLCLAWVPAQCSFKISIEHLPSIAWGQLFVESNEGIHLHVRVTKFSSRSSIGRGRREKEGVQNDL